MEETLLTEKLLAFAWQYSLFDKGGLRTSAGESVTVVNPGIRAGKGSPAFRDAEVTIGGKTYAGAVSVMGNSSDWYYRKLNHDPTYDSVIMNIVGNDDRIVRKLDGSLLPALEIRYPERLRNKLKVLSTGAEDFMCGRVMTRETGDTERKVAFTRLMVERLERKYNDIMRIHRATGENWHETFHIIFFRTMGLNSNKEVYMSLAQNIPYSKLCRERDDTEALEAIIFGVAGLLDARVYDEYKARLAEKFEELRVKHELQVLEYCEWTDRGVRPYNFVPKRLAQLAKLIGSNSFTFENVMACDTVAQLKKLFDMELSDYWKRSFSFGKRSPMAKKAVGDVTMDIVIINLVVPMMFAYGRHITDEALQEKALDLLYEIPGEVNKYTKGWKRNGVKSENAFYSQALIQLSTEYCMEGRCTECFVGIKALKNI